jgi:hypothetical protein
VNKIKRIPEISRGRQNPPNLRDVQHLLKFEERGEIEIKRKGIMMKTWFIKK